MTFILFIILIAFVIFLISFALQKPISPAEKLRQQQGHLTNTILGESAGQITLPLELQYFPIFQLKGNYLTDIFVQPHHNEKLYSFLLHGKTFQTKVAPSNPLPGAGAVGKTSMHCYFGKLPVHIPQVQIFHRHAPQDVPPLCTLQPFTCGQDALDKKYIFAGNPSFAQHISQPLISWLGKNHLYVMIDKDWMLLVDPKQLTIPNNKEAWQNQMLDMSAWTSLQDILNQK